MHYIKYVTSSGATGVALVPAKPGRSRPSWSDCAKVIPGFFRGEYLARKEA